MRSHAWRRFGCLLAGALICGLSGAPRGARPGPGSALALASALCDPPVITTQPESLTLCAGRPATFRVQATGTPPLEYQWRKDGVDIAGAERDSYTIEAVGAEDAGVYDVVVSNACGQVTSDPASLTVHTAPRISVQPADAYACAGDPVAFSVTAEGTEPLSYQWRKDGTPIDGATEPSYTIEAVGGNDAGLYDVLVTNECGQATSQPAGLFVGPPQITRQPRDQSACAGARLTLSVEAEGAAAEVAADTIGLADDSNHGPRIRGNAYAVAGTTMLTRIEHYLDVASAGALIFFAYEAASAEGPYTLVLEDSVQAPADGPGFYASHPLYLPLIAGRYYIIGAAWPGDYGYYWGGEHPQATAFGESLAGYATSYRYPLPDQPGQDQFSALVYHQRLTTTSSSLSFQWRKDDADIPGARDPAYVIDSAGPADTGDYQVAVANACGQTLSQTATVIVPEAPPTITQQPLDQAACAGQQVTFSVVADGLGLSYQWRKDGVEIDGATAAQYTIASASSADAGQYDVVVSNPCGATTSDPATLRVDSAPPTITQQPVSQTVCVGDAVTFSVLAEGEGLSYQWRKNDVDIPGATDDSYTIDPVSLADEGYYEVVVANACGQTPSDAATLSVLESGPTIIQSPADQSACQGEAVSFTVVAEGQSLSYQWRKDGQEIPQATEPSYTIEAVTIDDAGAYDVVVSNPCAALVSDAARLTVDAPPTITDQPVAQQACAGDSVTFTVSAEGGQLAYQWRLDDEDIPGATGSSYTIESVGADDAGGYDVVVSNACGAVSSDTATLTVADGPPAITEQPADQTACQGQPATFSVTATGQQLSYQWRRFDADAGAWVEIAGATEALYTIAAVTPDDAGDYDVQVRNACRLVTSQTAALAVPTWPVIDEQPRDRTSCVGERVSFSVLAHGSPPLSYQWRKDGTELAGANGSAYTIDAVSDEDAGSYDVLVSNGCGPVVSAAALLTVGSGARIDVQPADQTACEGQPVSFSVEASAGDGPADTIGTATDSGSGPRVRGNYYAVSATATLTRIEHYLDITTPGPLVFFVYESQAEDGPYALIAQDRVADAGPGEGFYPSGPLNVRLQAGRYYIIGAGWPGGHSYYWGGAHPQQTAFGQSLYGYAAPYQDPLPPTAPHNTSSLVHHQRLTTSSATLSYQWRRNGADIPGADQPTYTIDAVAGDDAGVYDVLVGADCGDVASDPALLTVQTAPLITQQPADQGACAGGAVTFELRAVGTPPLSYQWRKDGQNIDGATDSSYTIDPVTFGDAGVYDVLVSNVCGSLASEPATLTVTDSGPTIVEQPADAAVCQGDPASFTVLAEGQALSYQWRKDDVEIPGATGPVYAIDAAGPEDAGDYDVLVSNPCGQQVSDAATLTVAPRPPGDLDGDGDVDQADLGILLASWQADGGGDLDADGDTDQADLGILLANWQASCP